MSECFQGQIKRTLPNTSYKPLERIKEMTETTNESQEGQAPFDVSSCMTMMQKMISGEGCECAEMMAQTTNQGGIPEEWLKVMSQMMETHCRAPEGKVEER
jgi:hypothetical protein